jgi:hypothetical protein
LAGRRILFSAQKNEGPFLLEWIAFHKVVGFSDIVIYSNDCSDGSDDLLDRLAAAGEIHHHRQTVPPGASPQLNAAELFLASGFAKSGDWVMWLDTDEYLCVHAGAGRVDDLIAALPEADAIGVAWRVFGSAGVTDWPGEQISETFVRASRRQWPPNTQVKTLFRFDRRIRRMHLHRPVFARRVPAGRIAFFGSDGQRVPDDFIHHMMPRMYPRHRLARSNRIHALAQVNHYAVRTPDLFARKRARGRGLGSAVDPGVRHTDDFFAAYDRGEEADEAILKYVGAKKTELQRLLRLLDGA